MKKHISVLPLIFLLVLVTAGTYAQETPPTNPWVATYDENGNPTDTFNVGQDVMIKAYSSTTPYDVIVYDPDNNIEEQWQSNDQNFEMVVGGITDELGYWRVEAGTAETHYAVAWYEVIPGTQLGTIAVLLAGFASLLLKKRAH